MVLLVGQSHVALGDDAAAASDGAQRTVAVDALGEMEVVDSLPQKQQQQQVRRDTRFPAAEAVLARARGLWLRYHRETRVC